MTRPGDYEREFSDRTDSARITESYIQQLTLVLCDGTRPGLPRDLSTNQQLADSHPPLVNQLVEQLRRSPLVGGHILHAPNGRTYWRERIDLRCLGFLDRRHGMKYNSRAEQLGIPASYYSVITRGDDKDARVDLYVSAEGFLAYGSSWGTERDFGRASADLLLGVEGRR